MRGRKKHCERLIVAGLMVMLFCELPARLSGQTEKYIQTLSGSIKKGDSCVVIDDKFGDPGKWKSIERHWSVDNLITFELRYDTNAWLLNRNFTCTLEVDIEFEKEDRTMQSIRNISLQLNYDTAVGKPHQGIAWYRFTGGHYVKLTVRKITSPEWGDKIAPAFRIKNEIIAVRSYYVDTRRAATEVKSTTGGINLPGPLSSTRTVPAANMKLGASASAPHISWDPEDPALQGYPEFDLEWSFVNDQSETGEALSTGNFDFSQSALEGIFRNNASRVTISMADYTLNMLYETGWILYRIRGVSYNTYTGVRTEGSWSYAGNYLVNGAGYGVIRNAGHEPFLNWQYQQFFSEKGKRKELVSYYDGSLRERQKVKLEKREEGEFAVAQENIPDAIGRCAVSVLPAPTEDRELHFFPDFSQSSRSMQQYGYEDFQTNACSGNPLPMSNLSGASRYYSPNNPRQNDSSMGFFFTKYLPDAEGYPFALVDYTPDNTGHLRRVGAPGARFQPGRAKNEDHTTRYFYGKPQQEELDRLFGNEAGDASHYLKNMVIDANGQASVSWLNASGQTIATALAGAAPPGLRELPSHLPANLSASYTISGREELVRDPNELSITYHGNFLAPSPGLLTLKYSFMPLSLQLLYGTNHAKICADCYYDMQMNITNQCGDLVQSLRRDAVFTERTACLPAPTQVEGSLPVTIDEPGEFQVSYKLFLSQKAIRFYTDQYLLQDLSIKKETDFQREYLHRLDFSGCFDDCSSCLQDLGTESDFVGRISRQMEQQYSLLPDAADSIWLRNRYQQLLQSCRLMQEGCGNTAMPCEELTYLLRQDLIPGGQYMRYDPVTKKFIERDINVFLKNRASVTRPVIVNGLSRPFNQLTEDEVIDGWQDEWADLLLPYHPENMGNCLIKACSSNAAIEVYEKNFLNTNNYSLARDKGFWNRKDFHAVVDDDPYFKAGAAGFALKNRLLDSLANFKGSGYDILSFVRWLVYCKPVGGNSAVTAIPDCIPSADCEQEQDEWTNFRGLYFSIRQGFRNLEPACISDGLFQPLPKSVNDFIDARSSATATCTDLSHFELLANEDGSRKIRYTGAQDLSLPVTVGFFSVNVDGKIVNATGSIVFPAGTASLAELPLVTQPGLDYAINFVRCDPSHPYYNKQRRNYTAVQSSALAQSVGNSDSSTLNKAALNAMTASCKESCDSYADGWTQRLQGCNLDSARWQAIRLGLLNVCKTACSINTADHPFGESTISVATVDGDLGFRDVLLRVLGESGFTTLCNDLCLDFPPPAKRQPLYVNNVVRTLSDCAYQKLAAWREDYEKGSGFTNFVDYIRGMVDPEFSLDDVTIDKLIKAYETHCLLLTPVVVPASLSCNSVLDGKTCLSCSEMQFDKMEFMASYPFVSVDDPEFYETFSRFVNRKYNFNLSSTDAFDAVSKCTIIDTTRGAGTVALGCEAFETAFRHFDLLKPDYRNYPAYLHIDVDSLYRIQLIVWLNTELHQSFGFDTYESMARACRIGLIPPHGEGRPAPGDTCGAADCAPLLISCCDSIPELDKFRQVFRGAVDAHLLALYFRLLRSQWCSPLNLPDIDFMLPADSIVDRFRKFRFPNAYNMVITPDSFLAVITDNSAQCNSTVFDFEIMKEENQGSPVYAVCNKPMQPAASTDSNACINDQIALALFNAHNDYQEYIIEIARDYRNAYHTKCLNATPSLQFNFVYSEPPAYHFTLHYYDQAGNLVKTVPPAGIRPVDEEDSSDEKMARIKNYRLADRKDCYEFGDAPWLNGQASITVAGADLPAQADHPFTAEMFFRPGSLEGYQLILARESVNPLDGRKDGYRVYFEDGHLKVDISAHSEEQWTQNLSRITNYTYPSYYAGLPPVSIRQDFSIPVLRSVYREITLEVPGGLADWLKPGDWSHLAIEITGNRQSPAQIFADGAALVTHLVKNAEIFQPASAPPLSAADATAGTIQTGFEFNSISRPPSLSNALPAELSMGAGNGGFLGDIKQFRLYHRLLTLTEIRANAFNSCLMPQSEGKMILWLPLNREESVGVCQDRTGQITTINHEVVFSSQYQPVYPVHQLQSYYAYNTLNESIRQTEPDGGNTIFFYDAAGRLVASQNSEQRLSTRGEPDNRYSYTVYDGVGRIIEAGEKLGAATLTADLARGNSIDGNNASQAWLASGINRRVVKTIYDQPNTAMVANRAITDNQNLYNSSRTRVVSSLYYEDPAAGYNNGTHYQYDISGNLERIWQEHKTSITGFPMNLLKEMKYDYDRQSGKVNSITYQPGKGDQFEYRYEYDPENRLIRAFSGRDKNTLQQDISYHYYLHGALARAEFGDGLTNRLVQGNDYAYTLQGWLKGINGAPAAGSPTEMGLDGSPLSENGLHASVARDAMAFTLFYFKDDYRPIGVANAPAFNRLYEHSQDREQTGSEIFNGNIAAAAYGISPFEEGRMKGYSYAYDQLSRIREMYAHEADQASLTWNNGSAVPDYHETFAYDDNGNIAKLFRNGSRKTGALEMDDLRYQYYYFDKEGSRRSYSPLQAVPASAVRLTNQLAYITDKVPDGNYSALDKPGEKDINNQGNNNYSYDGLGNLVNDKSEGIDKIEWTVYGKIQGIAKTDGTRINFDYDASGNRIRQQVSDGRFTSMTSYIRDLCGNLMAVYCWRDSAGRRPIALPEEGSGLDGELWTEQYLYGNTRLGLWNPGVKPAGLYNPDSGAVQVGSKFFELTNHLGNVLAVVSDRVLAIPDHSNPGLVHHYEPELVSAGDYSVFGSPMAGRTYRNGSMPYRYGFNGKETDSDVKGLGNELDYGMRIYDPRIARFLSVDPIAQKYPELSPYQFASNSPISGSDQDGLEYSPAGRRGIFSIDNTAVQLYPDNPEVIEKQKAAMPAIQVVKAALAAQQHLTVITPRREMNEFRKERHEIDKANWYDRDGYTEEGKPTPATRLASDKTWTAFADHLALPALDFYTAVDGGMAIRRILMAPGFIPKAEFSLLSKKGTLDPFRIRYSQNDIKFEFMDGNNFEDLIEALRNGDKVVIPPIRIVEGNDMVFTLDNRRLYCYRQANVPIPYKKLNKTPRKELKKFSNSDIGNLIRVRKPK